MTKPVILTGVRANNDLHIGNYFGAILPIVDMARRRSGDEIEKIERVATAVFHNKGDGVVHFLFVYVAVFVCGREGGDRKLLHLATALPSWSFKRIVMLSGKKSV